VSTFAAESPAARWVIAVLSVAVFAAQGTAILFHQIADLVGDG
jgi:hypothetical protein